MCMCVCKRETERLRGGERERRGRTNEGERGARIGRERMTARGMGEEKGER